MNVLMHAVFQVKYSSLSPHLNTGDEAMQRVFSEILWPAARRFQPEFILVSAGE